MGILNVTPDSFSDGRLYQRPAAAVRRGLQMAEDGADLIDVGGESTRPGARAVSLAEELRRVIPVIERLASKLRVPISADTSKAAVAREAIRAGASLINDVTALRGDPGMAEVVAEGRSGLVLMHMQGVPRSMQRRPRYREVVSDVAEFLRASAARAEAAGIARPRILIDPGLGFGKTVAHNLALMRALGDFVGLGYPVVIGPSRKSFIGATLDVSLGERLPGTLACVGAAFAHGVQVVRVHDVRETAQFLRMLEAGGFVARRRRS